MSRWLRRLFAAVLGVMSVAAVGHEMTMAEMQLRETARGEFVWEWTASGNRPAAQELTPVWPAQCHAESNVVRCEGGLTGTLAIDGVGQRYSAALVKVFWLDGQSRVYTITAGQPRVRLFGSADDPRGIGEIARAYTLLGIEHILTGVDHLLFVMGLLFLVGFRRRLIATITAFTLAHSLTLASSALGWLTLRPAPVEATIALSIMLVAGESLRARETLARRWPSLVAFLFGLLHGLGFAGALKEIGLPERHLAVALGTFNVGVEIGQIMTVLACWAAVCWLRRRPEWPAAARRPALYAIGSVAAYWTWLRIASLAA